MKGKDVGWDFIGNGTVGVCYGGDAIVGMVFRCRGRMWDGM